MNDPRYNMQMMAQAAGFGGQPITQAPQMAQLAGQQYQQPAFTPFMGNMPSQMPGMNMQGMSPQGGMGAAFGSMMGQMPTQYQPSFGGMPQQQPQQQAPVDWRRYGLNDRQQQRLDNRQQAYAEDENIGRREQANLAQMEENMRRRNSGEQVARGAGLKPMGGRNQASDMSMEAKVAGGKAGRKGMAGSKPGRIAQSRRNARRQ